MFRCVVVGAASLRAAVCREGARMAGPRVVLCGVGNGVDGMRWESATRVRIGRRHSLEIVLNDASVSREHAEITCTPQGWVVRDLGSRNGTWINETPVKGDEQPVRAGDVIIL